MNNNSIRTELLELVNRLSVARDSISQFIDQSLTQHVFWVEKTSGRYENFILRSAPVDVSEDLSSRFFDLSNSLYKNALGFGIIGSL